MRPENQVKVNQKVINTITEIVGLGKALQEKEFNEIDNGSFVSVDDYLKKQKEANKK